ncbi:hypothetical protein L1987_55443 [Smallanthus sonchifolius]|uniref:Uncharacterized protein n=1 Tax=Smallanthus sonchifolius TaxID=185202 RepID=A0ACB9EAN0_9ASTR|nr:hypothetical protein L1987_55443 [Smallanthus sonchifolius]
MASSFEDNKSIPITISLEQPSNIIPIKSPNRDTHREQRFISKPVKKMEVTAPPKADAEMKTKILKLMKDITSSFDFEEYIEEKRRRCTHKIYSPKHGLDKTITIGKAAKAALKKLDDGVSVEDAKAVYEPHFLNQLIRWKKKLSVFLSPFLIGPRYTSFGRHFTKVDKLKEIVDRLHCCFMKEKLESTGKKCKFKNYELIITPKVMGLNPPFGVEASLANKFIDHALKFKPKLCWS